MSYSEMDIPLFEGRVLLKARDFAKLIHAATVSEQDLVLDLGCGHGYSAAVLARMANMVIAVEDNDEAVTRAEERLSLLRQDNIVVAEAPLKEGLAKQGPYDVIVLAGGAVQELPESLFDQLKEGGRLVCLEQHEDLCQAVVWLRSAEGMGRRAVFEAPRTTILPDFARAKEFVF